LPEFAIFIFTFIAKKKIAVWVYAGAVPRIHSHGRNPSGIFLAALLTDMFSLKPVKMEFKLFHHRKSIYPIISKKMKESKANKSDPIRTTSIKISIEIIFIRVSTSDH
jgi:hypothetical protein